MKIIQLIAFILLSLYFIYKLIATIIVLIKYKLEDVQEEIKSIKTMSLYKWGLVEHIFFLLLIQLIYWI